MNKKILRRGIIGLLFLVLVASGGYGIKTMGDFQQEAAVYQEAQDSFLIIEEPAVPLAETPVTEEPVQATAAENLSVEVAIAPQPTPNPMEPNLSVDMEALTAVSPDSVGWIHIPNSVMSYPLLQGDNNQEYVRVAYNGGYSLAGSIFMDYRVSSDFSDLNTVIYGHNMQTDTMFSDLHAYEDVAYADANPYFFILTEEGYRRYEVCYAFTTESDSFVYDYDFTAEGSYQTHLDQLQSCSLYDREVIVTDSTPIVTLSTCTGVVASQRFVVVGRLCAIVNS